MNEIVLGPADAEPLVLLVVGDSIAAGYGLERFEETLAGRVAARLAGARRVVCRMRAVSGSLVGELQAQAPAGDEEVVLAVVGSNDISTGTPLATFSAEFREALRLYAHARLVIVVGPGQLSQVPGIGLFHRQLLGRRVQRFADAIGSVSREFPNVVPVPPPPGLRLQREHFGDDAFHPSAKGHELIFRLVEPALATLRN